MKSKNQYLLALNAGSSSIKFALYNADDSPTRLLGGKIDRIGLSGTNLTFKNNLDNISQLQNIAAPNHRVAADTILKWLAGSININAIKAVGHRIVHGMKYTQPTRITGQLLKDLRRIKQYNPEHLPGEIELIEVFRKRKPNLLQVACFDTAFHTSMPQVAKILPIPRRFYKMGIQRYGFHGLSYTYLMEELTRLGGKKSANGRVILAHLGNGASITAVKNGRSIDTSMGLTPAGGLPMSTRTGDLDPGIAWFLLKSQKLTPAQFNNLVNNQSGLLGISQISPDMRDLLRKQTVDTRAAEAVDYFCYHLRKWVGAFSAALGGLDTLVFSGGIGENAPQIRKKICSGLQFLGIKLNPAANNKNANIISNADSRVTVRIIPADEELMIARILCRFMQHNLKK